MDSEPNAADERKLTAAFQAARCPPVPANLETRVRQLRRRRRQLQVGACAIAAAVVLGFGTLAFLPPPAAPLASNPLTAREGDNRRELAQLLTQPPPVVAVAQGQAEWLKVLDELCEGQRK